MVDNPVLNKENAKILLENAVHAKANGEPISEEFIEELKKAVGEK